MGYFDGQRYVTSPEAEGRQRPFDRNRGERIAVAKDLVRFGQPEQGFAEAGGERDLVKAAARQMLAMNQHADDPEAISAALAERGQEARELGFDVDGDPYVNSELVGEMAEDADQLTSEVRQEREAGEVQDAFGHWVEETFGVDALADHLADAHPDDQQGLIDALVDRFETETGFDTSSVDTSSVEPDYQPATFADDDDGEGEEALQ